MSERACTKMKGALPAVLAEQRAQDSKLTLTEVVLRVNVYTCPWMTFL